jgi:hypothetical protein
MISLRKSITVDISISNHREFALQNAAFFKRLVIRMLSGNLLRKLVDREVEKQINLHFTAENLTAFLRAELARHGAEAGIDVTVADR